MLTAACAAFTMCGHRPRMLRSLHRGLWSFIALVRFAYSPWRRGFAKACIPSPLNRTLCRAFPQTVYKPAPNRPNHQPCTALKEFIQTVQTVYKPSYKPCTALKEFVQTVQTVTIRVLEVYPLGVRFVRFVRIP